MVVVVAVVVVEIVVVVIVVVAVVVAVVVVVVVVVEVVAIVIILSIFPQNNDALLCFAYVWLAIALSNTGCTPLYRAILSNSTEVTQLLIHARADVNLRRLGIGAAAMAESPLIK